MSSKIFTILFFGLFFWLVYIFLFYSGLFVNYIRAHRIPVYFNEFFVETQIWWIWGVAVPILGLIFVADWNWKKKIGFYLLLFLLAISSWIPSWGKHIGMEMFGKKNLTYRFNHIVVHDVAMLFSSRGRDFVKIPHKKEIVIYPTKNRVMAPSP
jgi:hypothetical protein